MLCASALMVVIAIEMFVVKFQNFFFSFLFFFFSKFPQMNHRIEVDSNIVGISLKAGYLVI